METNLPLPALKQAILKMESALLDIREIVEDENVTDEDREDFNELANYTSAMIAVMYNKVNDDENFINETIEMDKIGSWPGESESDNIMDEEIV